MSFLLKIDWIFRPKLLFWLQICGFLGYRNVQITVTVFHWNRIGVINPFVCLSQWPEWKIRCTQKSNNSSESNIVTVCPPCKISSTVGSASNSTVYWLPHSTAGIACPLTFDYLVTSMTQLLFRDCRTRTRVNITNTVTLFELQTQWLVTQWQQVFSQRCVFSTKMPNGHAICCFVITWDSTSGCGKSHHNTAKLCTLPTIHALSISWNIRKVDAMKCMCCSMMICLKAVKREVQNFNVWLWHRNSLHNSTSTMCSHVTSTFAFCKTQIFSTICHCFVFACQKLTLPMSTILNFQWNGFDLTAFLIFEIGASWKTDWENKGSIATKFVYKQIHFLALQCRSKGWVWFNKKSKWMSEHTVVVVPQMRPTETPEKTRKERSLERFSFALKLQLNNFTTWRMVEGRVPTVPFVRITKISPKFGFRSKKTSNQRVDA